MCEITIFSFNHFENFDNTNIPSKTFPLTLLEKFYLFENMHTLAARKLLKYAYLQINKNFLVELTETVLAFLFALI